jgi:hypothetical protein
MGRILAPAPLRRSKIPNDTAIIRRAGELPSPPARIRIYPKLLAGSEE